ncbi:hypothetical protein ACJMK2_013409, partial [Sinanodonta woodiana]
VYTELFLNDSTHSHCIPHHNVLSHLVSVPTHLDNYLDCQWEIINHYTTIIGANGLGCNCFHEHTNYHTIPNYVHSESTTNSPTTSEHKPTTDHTTLPPTHSTSSSMSLAPALTLPYTCQKESTISTVGYGKKQTNPGAGNCHPDISDHMAPEALVMNMCNVTGHSDSWTRGQNVMSVCQRIPLYTPVATFFEGKYSSQGGLAGIFVGCLQGGFKMIVQECDKNITVLHVVTGGHFQLDPVNYSIIM